MCIYVYSLALKISKHGCRMCNKSYNPNLQSHTVQRIPLYFVFVCMRYIIDINKYKNLESDYESFK